MVPVNNYKILFYFTEPFNPSKGGVERVSIVLGKWLTENGCTIFYLSNKCVVEKNSLNHIYLPQDGGLKRKENWAFFKEFILNNSIDIIINQAGIFPTSLPLVELKGKALLLSVMHNTLFGMYTHPNLHTHNRLLLNILETCWAKSILKRLFYFKYHCYFKQIVEGSDAVLLLSESFKKELNYYSRGSLDKVVIIPNPLTIPPNDLIYSKRKEVLFVGRLEYQKRPDLLLDIWKKVAGFSKGMKSRLNFARSIIHQPKVLFLDEPTSGLDPSNSQVMKNIILDLKNKGVTIILTTHNMHDATELCDRVAFIVDGNIKAMDTPHNLIMSRRYNEVTYSYLENQKELNTTIALDKISTDKKLQSLIQANALLSIHSNEPTLDNIFSEITGRKLL